MFNCQGKIIDELNVSRETLVHDLDVLEKLILELLDRAIYPDPRCSEPLRVSCHY